MNGSGSEIENAAMRESFGLVGRLAVYAAITGMWLSWLVTGHDYESAMKLAAEFGLVEWSHAVTAAITMILFGAAARSEPEYPSVLKLACAAMAFLTIRELDYLLDVWIQQGAYKYLNAPVVVAALWILWSSRDRIVREIVLFLPSPAAWLSMFGLVSVTIFAQVLGQRPFWFAILNEQRSMIMIKRTVEELMESPGYAILMFAAFEALLAARGLVGRTSRT